MRLGDSTRAGGTPGVTEWQRRQSRVLSLEWLCCSGAKGNADPSLRSLFLRAGAKTVCAMQLPAHQSTSQQRFQIFFEGIRVFEADDFRPKDSLAVVEHCGGETFDAAKLQFQIIGGHC